MKYDILGRVKRQSVPTETNSSYIPAGDDVAGALWTHLKYDWMGRVVRKINTAGIDQTTLNDSDICRVLLCELNPNRNLNGPIK